MITVSFTQAWQPSLYIRTNSQCKLVGTFKQVINKFYRTRLDELAHISRSYGGHPKAGTIRDINQNEVFQSLISTALFEMMHGRQYTIVHVGSKFAKMNTKWHASLLAFYSSLAHTLMILDDFKEWFHSKVNGKKSPETVRSWLKQNAFKHVKDASKLNNHQKTVHAGILYFAPLNTSWKAPTTVHVRPRLHAYDDNYWRDNLPIFKQTNSESPHDVPAHLVQGTMQDLTREVSHRKSILEYMELCEEFSSVDNVPIQGVTVEYGNFDLLAKAMAVSTNLNYVMMDSHYYLAPETPEERDEMFYNPGPETRITFHVQGQQFHTVPGHYYTPWREGEWTCSGEQIISMACTKNGGNYEHKNVQFVSLDGLNIHRLSWLSYFYGHIDAKSYLFQVAPTIQTATPPVSCQAKWMLESFQVDVTNPKFSHALKEWKKRAGEPHQWQILKDSYRRLFLHNGPASGYI